MLLKICFFFLGMAANDSFIAKKEMSDISP